MRIRGRGTREGQRAHIPIVQDAYSSTDRLEHPVVIRTGRTSVLTLNARSHLPWRAPLNHEIRPGTRAHAPRRNATMTLYDPTRGIDKRDIDWGRHEPRVHRTAARKHQDARASRFVQRGACNQPLARCQYVTASSTSPSQPSSHRARAAIARHATSRPGRMEHDAIRGAPRLESRPPLPALRIDCPYRGVGAARKPSNVSKIQDAPLNHLIFKPSHVSPQHTASRPKPYPQQKDALHNHPRPPWIHRDGPRVRQFQGSPISTPATTKPWGHGAYRIVQR